MSASRRVALGLALAAGLGGACGGSPPAETALDVDVYDDGTPPRPTEIALSWLDDYGFLFKDRIFMVPAGDGSYLGNVMVRVYVADVGRRRALVRGRVGGAAVSEGWGISEAGPGDSLPSIRITLTSLAAAGAPDPNDADGDGVPDAIDNCPGLPNPNQSNLDCS